MTQTRTKPYDVGRKTWTYRRNDVIRIGDDVRIYVRRTSAGRTTLTIEAPRDRHIDHASGAPLVDSGHEPG